MSLLSHRCVRPLSLSLLAVGGLGLAGCEALPATGSALGEVVVRTDDPDCPPGMPCEEWPAGFAVTDPKTGSYGNYDLADRGRDGLDIRFIVIHTTEGSWDSTITSFQDPTFLASAHYLVRSVDGRLAKFVSPSNLAWHAGNWYFNMHSIGIEHEGESAEGPTWFTDALYQTSATLVRFLADKYHVPLDRQHIIGHDEVPGLSQSRTPLMHWDPGPYWDWDRFMAMVRGRPGEVPGDRPDDGPDVTGPIRIAPDYHANEPPVTYCFTSATDCHEVGPRPSNFLYLRSAPSDLAPLVANSYLSSMPADRMQNWGNKAGTGRLFYRADRSGDWDAIYYSGQVAWFKNPGRTLTRVPLLPSSQVVITPKAGSGSIAVYGGGYPGDAAYKPPTTPQHMDKVYDMPEGQRYVAEGPITADYYWAKVWAPTLPMSTNQVVKDTTPYYVVSFNHRLALVRAADVTVERPRGGHPGGIDRLESLAPAVSPPAALTPDGPVSHCDLKGMD